MSELSAGGSSSLVFKPRNWFKIQEHVNDLKASKFLRQIRGVGDAQWGNHYKNQLGLKYEYCPHPFFGLQIKLVDSHVIFEVTSA